MTGRFGVSGCAGIHTKAQDHPVQHPMAVNVAGTGASVPGDFAPEAAKLVELPWSYCGSFLVVFRCHLLSFRQPSSIGEEAQWGLGDSHL